MRTYRLNADKKGIEQAAEILKKGGIVAIPTETVYGLAASAYDEDAVKRVFEAKGRPQDNPLIVHIADIADLTTVAKDIPDSAFTAAKRFWPGPLTMIFKRTDKIPASVSAGLDTVAVRMPSDKTAREIIKNSLPLAAPSANTSGKPSPTSAKYVIDDLDGKIDGVVISGDCEVGVESTVITLVTNPPRLLRPGAVTLEELKEIFPDIVVDSAVLAEPQKGEKVASPGMKYKHYAPKTETYLVEGDSERFVQFVNSKENAAAVCFQEEESDINIPKLCYGTSSDEATLAHSVFSVLRNADNLEVSAIYVHAPSKSGVGLAVYNRLIRAAAFRVIKL